MEPNPMLIEVFEEVDAVAKDIAVYLMDWIVTPLIKRQAKKEREAFNKQYEELLEMEKDEV